MRSCGDYESNIVGDRWHHDGAPGELVMRYQGGKARVLHWLIPVIKTHWDGKQPYLEPFVGGCWVMASMHDLPVRYASDLDGSLILMWQALQQGWEPPKELSETAYRDLRVAEPSPLQAFAKYGCSWGGKPWGGYARSMGRNYAANARNSLLKKRNSLREVCFDCSDYASLSPSGCLIYCDPPYEATTAYENPFNWEEFWQCMRQWACSNTVLISSYEAPSDFMCMSEFERHQDMRHKDGRRFVTEKLFKYGG